MGNDIVWDTLVECGCVMDGHFLYSSGMHGKCYCQCAKLLQHPDKTALVIERIVEQVRDLGADILVGPAMGGIIVAYEMARQLGLPGIFTERENGEMKLRRDFEVGPGMKVLVTEDVVTTGKSSLETVKVLEEKGAEVIGLCCVVDRRPDGVDLGYPVYSAVALDAAVYKPEECPLCKEGLPLVKPGSRKITP